MNAAELNVHLLLAAGVVVVGVRAVGWLFGRFGQPRVMGEIVAGILLGPSVLGVLLPAPDAARRVGRGADRRARHHRQPRCGEDGKGECSW